MASRSGSNLLLRNLYSVPLLNWRYFYIGALTHEKIKLNMSNGLRTSCYAGKEVYRHGERIKWLYRQMKIWEIFRTLKGKVGQGWRCFMERVLYIFSVRRKMTLRWVHRGRIHGPSRNSEVSLIDTSSSEWTKNQQRPTIIHQENEVVTKWAERRTVCPFLQLKT